MQLIRCYSQPGSVRVIHIESGLPFSHGRKDKDTGEVVNPEWLQIVSDLAQVQARIGKVLYVPTVRPLTREEIKTVTKLRLLLQSHRIPDTWQRLNVSVLPEDISTFWSPFENQTAATLVLDREETTELFGARFSLGPVKHIFESAVIADEQSLQPPCESTSGDVTEKQLQFVPGKNNRMVVEYDAWKREHSVS